MFGDLKSAISVQNYIVNRKRKRKRKIKIKRKRKICLNFSNIKN
jgi:hypothetical protein